MRKSKVFDQISLKYKVDINKRIVLHFSKLIYEMKFRRIIQNFWRFTKKKKNPRFLFSFHKYILQLYTKYLCLPLKTIAEKLRFIRFQRTVYVGEHQVTPSSFPKNRNHPSVIKLIEQIR